MSGEPSQQAIDDILERLTEDHEFRELMLGDPVSAFKQYGIDIDPKNVPAVRKLPEPRQLAEARAHHAAILRNECYMIIFIAK